MTTPFRLHAGDTAPVQQTGTTCGSASLTIARMLVNPSFAEWILGGVRRDGRAAAVPGVSGAGTVAQRFAAYEQVVAGRTNALVGAGGKLQLPWPRALGTPPWGARHELEFGASEPGAAYRTTWTRLRGPQGGRSAYRVLRERACDGRPALLYIGNAWLPRHVVLVLSSRANAVEVYEPASGQVLVISEHRFSGECLCLAGWNVPWAVVTAA